MSKLKIMDFYVHQGHQREFFKGDHDFYLSGCNSLLPDWNEKQRPINENVTFISERKALKRHSFDIIMVRSPLNHKRYEAFHKRGATGIAVVQTTDPFPIPGWVPFVVWNSEEVMKRWQGRFPKKKHFYIPHGYDPKEFVDRKEERNSSAVSLFNVFKKRKQFLGYDLWRYLNKRIPCDLYGHGNEDLKMGIRETDSFEELIDIYNRYGAYLNTTTHSAMPRSRCEAMFCGMPMVSTDNYDIGNYMKNKRDGVISNDREVLLKGLKDILGSKDLQREYGERSKEIAMKYFHIDKYLERWENVYRLI